MESFKNLVFQEVYVLRGGERYIINVEEVVVGDIIFVKGGDRISVDIRVVEVRGFKVKLFFVFFLDFKRQIKKVEGNWGVVINLGEVFKSFVLFRLIIYR